MLSTDQIAADLGVTHATIRTWHRAGLITGRRIDGRGEHLYHPGQHRPDRSRLAAGRPTGTAQLLTSGQLATKLAVTRSTITRWHHLGLIDSPARDQRGFNLYHPDQTPPTPAQITAAGRPPDTEETITGGQLATRLSVSRSTIYQWYRLGLIDTLGIDTTGRHLYHPDQQAPDPTQIAAARSTAHTRPPPTTSNTNTARLSDPPASIDFTSQASPSTNEEPESSTRGAV